ncbi:MAG: hypothetical protein PHG31_02520 [Candidatus Omnitrophica bacterium]|nr:hypothetical protein [Candidatus Omnitrophota bacterium]
MVVQENPVFLFVGQDSLSKAKLLDTIKRGFLKKETQAFNEDILYARDLTLHSLQEKLLFLPLKSQKRLVVVKDTERLKEEVKHFLLAYAKKPHARVVLVLDFESFNPKEEFNRQIARHARAYRFKEQQQIDAFSLHRHIALKHSAAALTILNQLLERGEKPEKILGGLRYAWEREAASPPQKKNTLKALLHCDIDIKTGRLKPAFALEKCVVSLCSLKKSLG